MLEIRRRRLDFLADNFALCPIRSRRNWKDIIFDAVFAVLMNLFFSETENDGGKIMLLLIGYIRLYDI